MYRVKFNHDISINRFIVAALVNRCSSSHNMVADLVQEFFMQVCMNLADFGIIIVGKLYMLYFDLHPLVWG